MSDFTGAFRLASRKRSTHVIPSCFRPTYSILFDARQKNNLSHAHIMDRWLHLDGLLPLGGDDVWGRERGYLPAAHRLS